MPVIYRTLRTQICRTICPHPIQSTFSEDRVETTKCFVLGENRTEECFTSSATRRLQPSSASLRYPQYSPCDTHIRSAIAFGFAIEHSNTNPLPRREGSFLTSPSHRARSHRPKRKLHSLASPPYLLSCSLPVAMSIPRSAWSFALTNRRHPALSISLPTCNAEEKDGRSSDHLPNQLARISVKPTTNVS